MWKLPEIHTFWNASSQGAFRQHLMFAMGAAHDNRSSRESLVRAVPWMLLPEQRSDLASVTSPTALRVK